MTDARHRLDPATREGSPTADETPWPGEGFEDKRALAAIRGRLFGNPKTVRIGRFRIDRRLGAGGMGEVYLGFDDELDRKVAIKCVRPEIDDELQRERLRREARALAQLSHPNVVVAYEVGEHEDQTYIAMEYVEGQTLAAWLERPRRWQEILAQFVAAGRGLAAAHSAGVVHRDFKPENVLIGDDGRVRVADFGLALADLVGGGPGGAAAGSVLSRLTDAGTMVGTVRYMPLEQLRGDPELGPATDQFAFCVSLYEALWGEPPFALDSVAARIEALERGELRAPPQGPPRRLWTILRRGLAREPEERWAELGALLDALEAVPTRRRRLAFGLAGVGVAALLAGWPLLAPEPEQPGRCDALEADLAGIWDEERAERVRTSFGADEPSFARVDAALDGWAEAWLRERRAQCEALRTGRDDEQIGRARRSCLDAQRRRIEVFGDALTEASPKLIERAVEAALELPDPADCSADRMSAEENPSAALVSEIDALRLELAELEQLRLLGRARPARARELAAAAERLDHGPLVAEAVLEQGRTELAAGSPRRGLAALERAGDLALAADRDRLVAEIWLELAKEHLTGYLDLTLGERYAKLAEAQWGRLDPDLHTRSRLGFVRGRIAQLRGEDQAAAAAYRDALEQLGETQSTTRPGLLVKLAEILESEGEDEQAHELRSEALATAEQMWGPSHPSTAGYAFVLGLGLHRAEQREQARPLFERAVEIWMSAHGEPHPDLARAHELLVAQALADYREAEDEAEREAALARAEAHAHEVATIRANTLPRVHRGHGDAAMQLSRLAGLRGDRATALALALDALAHYRRTLGSSDEVVLALQLDVADSELGLGRLERASEGYLEVARRGPAPALRARAELGLAEVALRQGQLEQARGHIRAIEELGKDRLGGQILSLAILSAVVDLRGGCRSCTARARAELDRLVAQAGWSRAAIRGWLEELGLDPREAAALGFE